MYCDSFVYEWVNLCNGKRYIGCHKGSIDDGYISSSKYMLEDYNKDPSSWSRDILSVGTWDEMIALEATLQKLVGAASNPMYYNRRNGTDKFTTLGPLSETHKNNIKRGMRKIYTPEKCAEMSEKRRLNWQNEDYRKRVTASRKGSKNGRARMWNIKNLETGEEWHAVEDLLKWCSASNSRPSHSSMLSYASRQRKGQLDVSKTWDVRGI